MRLIIQAGALLSLTAVHALAGGAGLLPWEQPLDRIADSMTGPVAYGLGVAGIFASGGSLLFHGDMGEFGRRGCQVGLAASVCCLAAPFMANVIGVTGALI
jgi:type IV secretion system protein VirB2